jgi:hypothetical protein
MGREPYPAAFLEAQGFRTVVERAHFPEGSVGRREDGSGVELGVALLAGGLAGDAYLARREVLYLVFTLYR